MVRRFSILVFTAAGLFMAASQGVGQEKAAPADAPPANTFVFAESRPAGLGLFTPIRDNPGYLHGNHDFDRFIGFISNPVMNVDPRAMTAIWPMFGSSWASGNGPLGAEANAQIYGAGLYVALSDRLSFGLNQGGYAVFHANSDLQNRLMQLGLPVPERQRGGQRQGWLNLGGFVQYTLIADAENQFIATAGMRWEAPSGATQVFQGGASPTRLAPYLTLGKEFGCWHVLAVGGFDFPAGTDEVTTNTFYLNLHIDRKIGWLYPLVEFNGLYQTRSIDVNLPTRHGVLDMGTFSSTGNLLTVAVGANAVLVPNRLEFGAVYYRPVTGQDRIDFSGMLIKMLYRY